MEKTMWSGRFKEAQHDAFKEINYSIHDDIFLAVWDVRTSQAHANCLLQAGIIDDEAHQAITSGLADLKEQFLQNNLTPQSCDEDVHMWIERLLTEKIGDAGKKLHTGRSRNDQVATTLKLWLKDAYAKHLNELAVLIATLVELAEQHVDTIMPGCTHLQIAQPISLAFYFMAYVYKLKRDYAKGCDFLKHMDKCPLGSGAIAGTNYELSRELTQSELGFAAICPNAMDAISERDYVADYLYFNTLVATHLSQLSEDFIIWQSSNYQYITLSDAFSSGSSLMPQKKNPDALELIRGKAAVINGRLNSLNGLLKGIPMSYNKDLQEDKRLVYQTYCDSRQILMVMPEMLKTTTFHADQMKAALRYSYSNATFFADYLVMKGVPFRDAHHIVGKLVAHAIANKKELFELKLDELNAYCDSAIVDESIYEKIKYEQTIDNKKTAGCTNHHEVNKMIADVTQWLAQL